jgi:hypothetical protein
MTASWKTNRKTGKHFVIGNVIPSEPTIVSFEESFPIPVEDGTGQRYLVKYGDGHTVQVEFFDAFDAESSEVGEEEVEQAEDVEARDAKQIYTLRVLWNGAVDFDESYDSNDSDARLRISKRLIKRYGKIAEDFLGKSSSELEDDLQERIEDKDSESFL